MFHAYIHEKFHQWKAWANKRKMRGNKVSKMACRVQAKTKLGIMLSLQGEVRDAKNRSLSLLVCVCLCVC